MSASECGIFPCVVQPGLRFEAVQEFCLCSRIEAEADDCGFSGRREADEHEERAPGGCRGTPKKHNGLFGQSVGELGGKAIEAKDVEHPRKVVAERHQAPLAAHLVEATHEE